MSLFYADATILMLAFPPGHRPPLPRGMSRADIAATYPGWTITDATPRAADSQLPWFMEKLGADPWWYRLRRA